MIAHVGVGFDNIDVAAATRNGMLVSNTPGVLDDTTADLAFALMLAAARRVTEGDTFVRSGQWKRWNLELMIGLDIHHRTLGILGMGRIGQALAKRAGGFSMRVLYHNRTRLAPEIESELKATWVAKDQLLRGIGFPQHPRAAERQHASPDRRSGTARDEAYRHPGQYRAGPGGKRSRACQGTQRTLDRRRRTRRV